MSDFQRKYMTISLDIQPEGFNFSCWMSTEEFFQYERYSYPHVYPHVSEACTWLIRANMPLTEKALAMATEMADRYCALTVKVNNRRLPVNRR